MSEVWSLSKFKEYLSKNKQGDVPGKQKKQTVDPQSDLDPVKIILRYGFDPVKAIYIPGEVYSSKNSKQIWRKKPPPKSKSKWSYNNRPAVPFITDSDGVKKYKKNSAIYYADNQRRWIALIDPVKEYPLFVTMFFIRKINQRFDFNNLSQIICDQMVRHRWVLDDNTDIMLPMPPLDGRAYQVNKEEAGVIIQLGLINRDRK